MSKRTAVQTLLRVAELQEAVARGAAGRAIAAVAQAQSAHAAALDDLADAGLAGGTRAALETTTQVRLWRADVATSTEAGVVEAQSLQAHAVAGWTEARRRHRLFEQLAARKREEILVAREKAEQNLADELAGTRRVAP